MNYIDSDNFVTIDNTPYYKCLTNSYRDKLKNGLSFDYVFLMEDSYSSVIHQKNIDISPKSNCNNNNQVIRNDYYYYNTCELNYFIPFKKRGQIKNNSNKRKAKQQKNRIQKNGYYDKIWNRDQQFVYPVNNCQFIQNIQIKKKHFQFVKSVYINWLSCVDGKIVGFISNSLNRQYINIYIEPNDFEQLEDIENDFLIKYYQKHKVSNEPHVLYNQRSFNIYFFPKKMQYKQKYIEYITIEVEYFGRSDEELFAEFYGNYG